MTRRGESRLKLGQSELGEADFREAIALAQKMSAKAFALRATTSLARLLREQIAATDALAMLAEIYNWFTEGFDTADLKDAKALLEELSRQPQSEGKRPSKGGAAVWESSRVDLGFGQGANKHGTN